MLQHFKLLNSRNDWRSKAIQRGQALCEMRKTVRRYQAQIAQLKAELKQAQQPVEKKQPDGIPSADTTCLTCLKYLLIGVVSYRSIPRLLQISSSAWIPHFTSVINWTLRLGLGKLQQVHPIEQPWMVILDHSIDVGTKKLLVALRVPIHQQSALSLTDCECVGLHLSEQVTGETIAAALTPIFQQAGLPAAILKDNDRTLHKGVMCWQQQQALEIPVVQDISHVVAASLKRQFAKTDAYQQFTQLITQWIERTEFRNLPSAA